MHAKSPMLAQVRQKKIRSTRIAAILETYNTVDSGDLKHSLRKQAYSNIQKISSPKTEIFQIKILISFHISAQNIDCGYSLEPPLWGGSN